MPTIQNDTGQGQYLDDKFVGPGERAEAERAPAGWSVVGSDTAAADKAAALAEAQAAKAAADAAEAAANEALAEANKTEES